MSRFDYVAYDGPSRELQSWARHKVTELEKLIESISALSSARSRALALTKLEECYMWIGKAIREDQLSRNGVLNYSQEKPNECVHTASDTKSR